MATLSGEVQRVTYENEETGFRVLKLTAARSPGNAPPGNAPPGNAPPQHGAGQFGAGNFGLGSSAASVVVVGVFAPVAAGSQVRVTGNYVEDPKHGKQFRADSLVVMAPETLDGIERY